MYSYFKTLSLLCIQFTFFLYYIILHNLIIAFITVLHYITNIEKPIAA